MREWISINGLGSYASLTYSNENISKFHGLLVASLQPPTQRHVFVSNLYEKLLINDVVYDFSSLKKTYTFDTFPLFFYDLDDVHIKKTVFMQHEKNTTILKYEIQTNKKLSMILSPLVNSRHLYDLTSQHSFSFDQQKNDEGVIIEPENSNQKLKIFLSDSIYIPKDTWIQQFYTKDQARNDSYVDHNYYSGDLWKTIEKSTEFYLIFTLEDELYTNPSKLYFTEFWRKNRLITNANLPKKFKQLILSSENFIVKKGDKKSIVAGYPWFADWGRDTLIALPGITLVTKRFAEAKDILSTFSKYQKNGLIPNAFMDRDSKAVYNTVDASLWFIDRVYQYLKYTNDIDFIKQIWTTLQSIIYGYKNGTDYEIFMDADYLISHGKGLTWMDVKINDFYPTPRSRKAVEIQALWYNALQIMANLAYILGKNDEYSDIAYQVKENFNHQYDQHYDVIDTKDTSCRPNKIFLVSLDFPMIDTKLQKEIVENVSDKLLTIFGLKTLSADHPAYIGHYLGEHSRDLAYHNGTVWPWLLGPFISSFVKINNNERQYREYAYENYIQPMLEVYGEKWDGSIHEIFDADPPYLPHGCISQAWSVAEILRSWVEDIENIKPKYEDIFLHKIRV
ncbi:MAG: amylo-alpha-1,6-glucosidase [Thermoplasmatota archaeon]